jgi:hypothetical protein
MVIDNLLNLQEFNKELDPEASLAGLDPETSSG